MLYFYIRKYETENRAKLRTVFHIYLEISGMRMACILFVIFLGLAAICAVVVLQLPLFGGTPSGARLERIQRSPNYRDGQFHNPVETPVMTDEKNGNRIKNIWQFLFSDKPGLRPCGPLEMKKHDLKSLPADRDVYVWFGHSSYLLSLHGTTILVDPVFCSAAPFSFLNKPFEGTERYRPEDMPDKIDYLVITHDHYDHLDYETVRQLKGKTARVVCPLGVGAHFERWGFDSCKLIELDWNENATYPGGTGIHCLPARHFSGRLWQRNRTLWASFLFYTPHGNIFIGGDSGYGPHFRETGERHPRIDLAILENGQYNRQWMYIHTMPDQLGRAATELGAKQIITVHHSKYALARHPWNEPLQNEIRAREEYRLGLTVAELGDITYLDLK